MKVIYSEIWISYVHAQPDALTDINKVKRIHWPSQTASATPAMQMVTSELWQLSVMKFSDSRRRDQSLDGHGCACLPPRHLGSRNRIVSLRQV